MTEYKKEKRNAQINKMCTSNTSLPVAIFQKA